jgi:uncharacterized protein (DUF3084 family)
MLYTLLLIAVLIVLAGVIAYAGDLLGTTVGKKRLSLFGWRPKRTGQVVGIAVGVLIMLTTMSTLALAFRGATTVVLNAERVDRELKSLQREQSALLGNIGELESAIESRAIELEEARSQRNEAVRQRDAVLEEREALVSEISEFKSLFETLRSELDDIAIDLDRAQSELGRVQLERQGAEEEIRRLREGITALEADVAAANEELAEVRQELREAERAREQASAEAEAAHERQEELLTENQALEAARDELLARVERQTQELRQLQERGQLIESGQIAFNHHEPIHSATVRAQERGEIIEALREMILAANTVARQRGAEGLSIRTDQFDSLVKAIAETPGEDFVVLLSRGNQFQGSRLSVQVESRENRRLLGRGQLLLSRTVYLGSSTAPVSQEELRGELRRLRSDADRELKRLGLFEFTSPSFDILAEDIFIASLRRLEGPVVVGVVAAAPVSVSGPAELEFVVIR